MASTNCKEEREQGVVKPGISGKIYSGMMLSKPQEETVASLAVPSFRVYYGVASVPFLWESQPGTPKRRSSTSAATLPPLTPPPSYYAAAGRCRGASKGGGKRWPGGGVFGLLRRPGRRTSPCSSWSSSSPTASSMSPVFTVHSSPAGSIADGHRRAFSTSDIVEALHPPTARCFGLERQCEWAMMVKGCGVAVAVRNALSSVVGRKSGRRSTSTGTAA